MFVPEEGLPFPFHPFGILQHIAECFQLREAHQFFLPHAANVARDANATETGLKVVAHFQAVAGVGCPDGIPYRGKPVTEFLLLRFG